MSASRNDLLALLHTAPVTALVEVREVAGSTPREADAWMLVSPDKSVGTIGGGQLEFMAIDRARAIIAQGPASTVLDVPLGPEIGQCCGGRVKIDIKVVDAELRELIEERIAAEDAARTHVYLFGGGHVGHALAASLSLMPLAVHIVETRVDALEGVPEGVEAVLTAVPEEVVRAARPSSVFVVLTHDHALDFLIVAEALKRPDAAYVGMIGSHTKKETLRRWYLREAGGDEATFQRLVCPIGGSTVKDKRPAVIAAMAAAEVAQALFGAKSRV